MEIFQFIFIFIFLKRIFLNFLKLYLCHFWLFWSWNCHSASFGRKTFDRLTICGHTVWKETFKPINCRPNYRCLNIVTGQTFFRPKGVGQLFFLPNQGVNIMGFYQINLSTKWFFTKSICRTNGFQPNQHVDQMFFWPNQYVDQMVFDQINESAK